MKLYEIKKELELKSDINNLSEEKLFTKYGNNIRESICFSSEVTRLLKTNYKDYIADTELVDKLEKVVSKMLEKYEDNGFAKVRIENALRRIDIAKNNRDDSEYESRAIIDLNESLGISTTKRMFWDYNKIINNLKYTIKRFEDYGKKNSQMPDEKETKEVYTKTLKAMKNKKYVNLRSQEEDIISIYNKYPMMYFCYNKEFLILSNYLINETKLDEDSKDELVNITKNIISMSKVVVPISYLNGTFDKEDYDRIASYTLRNIKRYEKKDEENKNIAVKVMKKIFK